MARTVRRDVEFPSAGTTCRAWLFLPEPRPGSSIPCVVMAHGLGATREMALEPYAQRFAGEGYAVLLFDYRHFGASDGRPRQLLSVRRQLQDWQSAIDFARSLEGVDGARIALWGSSFSGGHVVAAAARDGRIAAVSSQCPMMDGTASVLEVLRTAGLRQVLLLVLHGLYDQLRGLLGLGAHTVPAAGLPGTVALMSTPDAYPGYLALAPPGTPNAVAARLALWIGLYRPGSKIGRLRCPMLVLVAGKDSVAPAPATERMLRRGGPRVEVKRYPIGHFDMYLGEHFERGSAEQLAFFRKVLAAP